MDEKLISYEQAKAEWIASHPDASPEEYQAAIFEIAKRLGI